MKTASESIQGKSYRTETLITALQGKDPSMRDYLGAQLERICDEVRILPALAHWVVRSVGPQIVEVAVGKRPKTVSQKTFEIGLDAGAVPEVRVATRSGVTACQLRRAAMKRVITCLRVKVLSGNKLVEVTGVEPATSAMRMPRSSQLSYTPKNPTKDRRYSIAKGSQKSTSRSVRTDYPSYRKLLKISPKIFSAAAGFMIPGRERYVALLETALESSVTILRFTTSVTFGASLK